MKKTLKSKVELLTGQWKVVEAVCYNDLFMVHKSVDNYCLAFTVTHRASGQSVMVAVKLEDAIEASERLRSLFILRRFDKVQNFYEEEPEKRIEIRAAIEDLLRQMRDERTPLKN